jgi:hypothetical protein
VKSASISAGGRSSVSAVRATLRGDVGEKDDAWCCRYSRNAKR